MSARVDKVDRCSSKTLVATRNRRRPQLPAVDSCRNVSHQAVTELLRQRPTSEACAIVVRKARPLLSPALIWILIIVVDRLFPAHRRFCAVMCRPPPKRDISEAVAIAVSIRCVRHDSARFAVLLIPRRDHVLWIQA